MKQRLKTQKDKLPSLSVKARIRSIQYALEGLKAFFSEQPNAVVHFLATAMVLMAAIFFKVTRTEAIAIIVVTAFVWSAEMFNTAVERLADTVSKEFDPKIKFIKDVSAGAVLLSAMAAVITGGLIFLPKILS